MADSNFVLARGFDAAAAITKHRAVKAGGTDESVTPVTAEGDEVLGVAMYSVTAGEIARGKGASVAMMGIVQMEAAATVAVGDTVAIDGSGCAVQPNSGARNIGMCVGNPGDSGDWISVLLSLPGTVTA